MRHVALAASVVLVAFGLACKGKPTLKGVMYPGSEVNEPTTQADIDANVYNEWVYFKSDATVDDVATYYEGFVDEGWSLDYEDFMMGQLEIRLSKGDIGLDVIIMPRGASNSEIQLRLKEL